MVDIDIRGELANVNSSQAFWRAMGSNSFEYGCSCSVSHAQNHFVMKPSYLNAQREITKSHKIIFEGQEGNRSEALANLLAVCKVQDQLSGGMSFSSKKTSEFKKQFGIKDCENGFIIEGQEYDIRDAKAYLVQKFSLGNSKEKLDEVLASKDSLIRKSEQVTDIVFEDFIANPTLKTAKNVSKFMPSLAYAALALGVAQLVMRSVGNQEEADELRDNIGASTEAAAFFVFANGLLENLAHSFLLAAPAYAGVGLYDNIVKRFGGFCENLVVQNSTSINDLSDLESQQQDSSETTHGHFNAIMHKDKLISLLNEVEKIISKDDLWIGLRNMQLSYKTNNSEENLKKGLSSLISDLQEKPELINEFLQSKHNQVLNDCFEMLKSYKEIYEKKNPGSEIEKLFSDFLETFCVDSILLTEPSKEIQQAAFYCKAQADIVSLDERMKSLIPHIPSGSQVARVASVIAALYIASTIYEQVTGEKENYSDYITDFPDHLFRWLNLEQMYENMGGGAEMTELFKDFFSKFNLAENSTHLGIMALPILRYREVGSKMFDSIYETPANYLAYAKNITSSYHEGFKSWLGFSERTAQEENLQESQILDLENGRENSQKSLEKEDEKKVEEKIDEFDTKNLCISISQDKKAISKKKKLKKNDQVSQTEFEKKDIATQTVSADFYESSNGDLDSEIDLEKSSVRHPKVIKLKQQPKQLTTHV
ncbi:MAG: hypothetical protein FJ368_02525 [Pelagibacterales bacterium]|nr:hypothetical protein [Pelagibacterales bacterium]